MKKTLQFGCHLAANKSGIHIGRKVRVGHGCSLYSDNHGCSAEEHDTTILTKGPIIIEEGAWLGSGGTVVSGARVGKDAVVAACSIATRDVPEGTITATVPAWY